MVASELTEWSQLHHVQLRGLPFCGCSSICRFAFVVVQRVPNDGAGVLLRLDSMRAQAADALEYAFTAALRQHIVRTLCEIHRVLQTLRSQK
jgi:hypothetical protein